MPRTRDVVLVTSPNRYKLYAMLRDERRRGALIQRTDVVQVQPGLWAVEVMQLRRFERPWVKPVVVTAGAVGILGTAVATGWWLLGVIVDAVAAAGAVTGAAALGIVAVLALVFVATRRTRTTEVSVKVRVRG